MIGENMSEKEIVFCKSGGCTAKLGAGVLEHILERLPKGKKDENLLVGYDSKDDAAVYRVNEHQAVVQTLDFFPPMVEDPYLFGAIAALRFASDYLIRERQEFKEEGHSFNPRTAREQGLVAYGQTLVSTLLPPLSGARQLPSAEVQRKSSRPDRAYC